MPEKDEFVKKALNFWPFEGYKDGMRRHWRWLRRWLLAHKNTGVAVISLVMVCLLLVIALKVGQPLLRDLSKKPSQPANSVQVTNMEKRGKATIDASQAGKQATSQATTQANSEATSQAADQGVNQMVYANQEQGPRITLAISKPMAGEVKTLFGVSFSPLYQDYRYHDGIDILSSKDDLVKAAMAGTIGKVSEVEGQGLMITIDHSQGYHTYYANITSPPEVSVGQWVNEGQTIGKVEAESGLLHFAIKKGQQGLNPLQYLSY